MWRIDELPLHPLVVHLPVVVIPLVAVGLVVYVVAPTWRRPLGLALLGLGVAGFVGAAAAVWSGDQLGDVLRRGDELSAHRAAGERTRTFAGVLAAGLVALVVYERRGTRRDAGVVGIAGAVAVVAVGATAAVALTGHTGARLAWVDKLAATTGAVAATPAAEIATAAPAARDAGGAVDVVLGEWALVTSVAGAPPGPTTFRFRNMGTVTHALRIRTQGSGRDRLEWRSAPVPPGGEGVLTVDLAARAYDLDCPVEDGHGEHDALGMETVFVVRDGAPPLGTPPPARTTAAAGSASTVEISGFAFAPAQLRVRVGARVTWRNLDPAPHTATGDGWDTGRLASGAASTIAFDRPGTFAYVCAVHPAMAATVVVAR